MKLTHINLVIVVLYLLPLHTFTQALPPIQLDRPDQTECPFITPKKYIQVENGLTFENFANGNKATSTPTSLWKYGINEKVELRLITEYASIKQNNRNTISGLAPITIGFKTSLLEEDGIVPKTSFIGHITTAKWGSKNLTTNYIAPSFRFVMQHTISPKVCLAYNLGAEWNGQTAMQTYIYTLTTGITLTEKLGCYAELYGFVKPTLVGDHRCDGGFTYLLTNDIIADISAGVGTYNSELKNYIALGLSYRFKVAKK